MNDVAASNPGSNIPPGHTIEALREFLNATGLSGPELVHALGPFTVRLDGPELDEIVDRVGQLTKKKSSVIITKSAIRAIFKEARAAFRQHNNRREGGEGVVIIDGVEKRLTTFADLNERYALLQAPGSASVYISRPDFLPIQDIDLKRRLGGEVVGVNEKYKPAFNFWTGHARRHIYRRVVFSSAQQPDDSYNLYRGLGVTPREGSCDRIIAHVKEVICSGNQTDADAMLKLHAWQIQNIGKLSRIIVLYKSEEHQAGKGIFLGEVMLKIYGPSGFTPATIDQVLGKFNDALRGRSFIFLDEVLFAGDRKSADALKRLSTTDSYGIETKNVPVVTCPIAVNCISPPTTPTQPSSRNTTRATGRPTSARIASATTNISLRSTPKSRTGGVKRSPITSSTWTFRTSCRGATCRRTMKSNRK